MKHMADGALKNLMERSAELAVDYYKDPSMDGVMTIFAECDDGKFNAMWSVPNLSNEFKHLMIMNIAASMKARNARAYSIMALAWMTEHSKEDFEVNEIVPPSQNENRREVLFVNAFDREGGSIASVFDVTRDVNSKLQGFIKDEKSSEYEAQDGFMAALLKFGDDLAFHPDFEKKCENIDSQMDKDGLLVSGGSLKNLKAPGHHSIM